MTTKSDDFASRQAGGQASPKYDLPATGHEMLEPEAPIATSLAPIRRNGISYRPAYLGEDDTVLACCHHAHEVAKAHGAREVMLEHLVHALARVSGAAAILDDRGIHVDALRRESAAVVYGEIPVENTTFVPQLRASKEFNVVMYMAAASAARRDERATSVRDILDALLAFDPKSRAVRLLRRHASGPDSEEQFDPLHEMRGTLDRYSSEMRELRLAVAELRNAHLSGGSTALNLVDDRMRSVERSINGVLGETGGDRMTLVERMKSLHDTILSQRSEMRTVADNMQLMERSLNAGMGNESVIDRLRGLERLISDQAPLSPAGLEGIATRLESLDSKIVESTKYEAVFIERLKGFEKSIEAQLVNAQRGWGGIGERLASMEKTVAAEREEQATFQQAVTQEIKALQGMLDLFISDATDGNGVSITGEHAEALKSVGGLGADLKQRFDALEARLSSLASATNVGTINWTPMQERFAGLERTLNAQRNDVASINQALDDELDQIRKAMQSLGHAQQTLSTAIDEWRQNNSGDLSIISNRLAALEKSVVTVPAVEQRPVFQQPIPAVLDRIPVPPVSIAVPPMSPVPQAPIMPQAPIAQQAQPGAVGHGGSLLDRVDKAISARYTNGRPNVRE